MAPIIPRTHGRDGLAVQLAAHRPLQRHVLQAPLLAQLLKSAPSPSAAPAHFAVPTQRAPSANTAPPPAVPVGGPTPVQRRLTASASAPLRPTSAPVAPLLATRPATTSAATQPESDAEGPLPMAALDHLAAVEAQDRATEQLTAFAEAAELPDDDEPADVQSQGPASWGLDVAQQAGNAAPARSSLDQGARAVTTLTTSALRADLAEHREASPPTLERSLQRSIEAFERGELVASASEAIDQPATPQALDDAAAPPAPPELPAANPTLYRQDDPTVAATALAAPAAASAALAGQEARYATAEPPPATAPGRAAPEPRAADAPLPDQPPAAVASLDPGQPPRASEAQPAVLPAAPPAKAPIGAGPIGAASLAAGTPATGTPVAPTLLPGPATSTQRAPRDADQAPAAAEPLSGSASTGNADPLSFAAEQRIAAAPAIDETAPLSVEAVSERLSGVSTATTATPSSVSAAVPLAGTTQVAATSAATVPSATVQRTSMPPSAPPGAVIPAADGNTSAQERIEPILSPPLFPGSMAAPEQTVGETGDVKSALTHRAAGEQSKSQPPADAVASAHDVLAQRSTADHEQQSGATVADVATAAPSVIAAIPLAAAADAPAPAPEPAPSPDLAALPADSAAATNTDERVDVPIQSSPSAAARPTGETGDDVPWGASAAAEERPPATMTGQSAPPSTLNRGAALLTAVGEAGPSAAPDAEPRWSSSASLPTLAAEPAPGPEGQAGVTLAPPRVAAAPTDMALEPGQRAGVPAPAQRVEAGAAAAPSTTAQRSVDLGTTPESTAELTTAGYPGVAAASTGVIAAESAIDSPDAPGEATDAGGSISAPINLPGASESKPSDDEGTAATPLSAALSERADAATMTPAVSDMGEPAPAAAPEAESDVQATTAAIQRTAATAAPPELSTAAVLETEPGLRTASELEIERELRKEPVLKTEPGLETVSPRGPRPIFRRRQPESEKSADAPSPAPDPAAKERLERMANLLLGRTAAPATERQSAADATARGDPSVTSSAAQATPTGRHVAPSADGMSLQRATAAVASAATTDRTSPEVDRSTRSETGGTSPAIDRQMPPPLTVQRAAPLASAALLPASLLRPSRAHEAPLLSADFTAVSSAAQASAPGAVSTATVVPAAPAGPTRDLDDGADDAPRWSMPPVVQATAAGLLSAGAPEAHASAPRTVALPVAAAIGSPIFPPGAPNLAARSTHALVAGVEGWRGAAPTLPPAPALPITSTAAADVPSAAAFLQRATDGAPTGAAGTPGVQAAAPSITAPLLNTGTRAAPATLVPPSLASDVPLPADDQRDVWSAEPPSMAEDALPTTSATVQRAVTRDTPPSALGHVTLSASAGAAPAAAVASSSDGEHAPIPPRDRGRWGNLPAPWEPLPTWLTAPAPEAAIPPTSLPATPPMPMVVQRTVAAETPDRPVSAPAAPVRSPSSQQPEADLDALARQVYGILRQRLLMEQRRGG